MRFSRLDRRWRTATAEVDELRPATRPKGKPTRERARRAGGEEAGAPPSRRRSSTRSSAPLRRCLARVPNPPDDGVPDGADDDGLGRDPATSAAPARFDFAAAATTSNSAGSTSSGGRLSGTRFAYRMGPAALVELSLYRYALDHLVGLGFMPVLPPVLVREEAMYGTGFLPTEEANLYQVEPDGLYLTGTSEVALAGLHQGEILESAAAALRRGTRRTSAARPARPARHPGHLPGPPVRQGRDVRLHAPGAVAETHEEILAIEESIVAGLGLAYRVVNIAAGDLGPPASKKYDIEAWIPTQGRYREITSCSNTTDYQARRLGVRYRDEGALRYPAHVERDGDDGAISHRHPRELPRARGQGRDRTSGGARGPERPLDVLAGPRRVSGTSVPDIAMPGR